MFARVTLSPQPVPASERDAESAALNAVCGESDRALITVAARFAAQTTDGARELDADTISSTLRAAGSPYVWPRAWLFTGPAGDVLEPKTRMLRWLSTFGEGGVRRCGIAVQQQAGRGVRIGAIAVDALADLEPLPTRVRPGQWLDVRASLRVPASDAKLVVMGPQGAPHPVPTSFHDGRVRARFNADRPGTWLVQLLADVEGGPRPLLEAWVFAGVEPPSELSVPSAPGEDAVRASSDPRTTLYALVNAARESEHLSPLEPDPALEALAQAHAEAMRRARKTAHDVGDGDLNQRLAALGLELEAGENVAHAGSAALAQRALWASPSHRENLLLPGFARVGIGVAPDPDGTLWVCQTFAMGR